MPCDTVVKVKVKLETADKNRDILRAAFKRANWTVQESTTRITLFTPRGQITLENGQAEIRRGMEGVVEEISRMYAEECIYVQAETNGWDVVKTGEHEFEVIRESGGWDAR